MMARCPSQGVGPPAAAAQPASVPGAQSAPGFVCDARRAAMDSAQQKSQAEFKAQLALELADPVKRAAMVEQAKAAFHAQNPRLKEFMGMKPGEFDEFLTLLADQDVQYQEWFLDCEKTHCVWDQEFPAFEARKRRATEDLLGVERSQRYNQYDNSRIERMTVGNFRKDLPDALHMSNEQSERLIAVLAEERQEFEQEARARGLELNTFGAGRGTILYDESRQSVQERVAAGREYSERLRARAAKVLTTEQLREYAIMQDAELASMESALPYQDSLRSAGIAAGNPAN